MFVLYLLKINAETMNPEQHCQFSKGGLLSQLVHKQRQLRIPIANCNKWKKYI